MPNYTDNLRLEKPLQSENYNIDIFNANADKIDTDECNLFNATNGEDALAEIQTEVIGNKTTLQNNINKIREVL